MDEEMREADATTVRGWLDDGSVMLVDVRETHEFEYEHIPGALLLPLSFLDTDLFPRIQGMDIVLVCAAGKRSAAAGKQLIESGMTNVVNLTGGMEAWSKAGLDTEGAKFEEIDYQI